MPKIKLKAQRYCSFKGCPNHTHSYDLCAAHAKQKRLGKPLKPLRGYEHLEIRVCSKCDNPVYAKGMCGPHYYKDYQKRKILAEWERKRLFKLKRGW
jgi:hypothetical protein